MRKAMHRQVSYINVARVFITHYKKKIRILFYITVTSISISLNRFECLYKLGFKGAKKIILSDSGTILNNKNKMINPKIIY